MDELILHAKCVAPTRIDNFIASQQLGLTRSGVKSLIEKGSVFHNGLQVKKAGLSVANGDIISIKGYQKEQPQILPQDLPLDIVYQDDDIAIINKAQGMVVHPAAGNYQNTLVNALLFHFKELSDINGKLRPGIVHRLDKDTSGLLLIAKNNPSHLHLAAQFKEHSVERYYTALLQGNLKEDKGEIVAEIGRNPKDRKKMGVVEGGRQAITSWSVIERFAQYCLVKFKLYTGRTHQIRVHAQHLGHPVAGDKVYGGKSKDNLKGQLLHADKLAFTHPTIQERLCFTAPLPSYFADFLSKLSKI